MTETLYCKNCAWNHGTTYIGKNQIRNLESRFNRECLVCEYCISKILKKHFEENKPYFERCDRP